MYNFISEFSSLSQWSVCLYTPLFHCGITVALFVLKSHDISPPTLLFLFKIVLKNLGSLLFHVNLDSACQFLQQNSSRVLTEVALILSLLIREHVYLCIYLGFLSQQCFIISSVQVLHRFC